MTHTRKSAQLNYDATEETFDREKDTAITKLITASNNRNFNSPIDTCDTCGQPLQKDIIIFSTQKRVPVICKCRVDELERLKEREEFQALQRKLSKFKSYSLMDERFEESTFENWKFRGDNRKLYDFGKRYCKNWESIKNNNRGLLIHGEAGNGKTYLSFAIANELYKQGKAVLAISVSRILKIIMDSYSQRGDIGEIEVLNTLYEASLLILDDLGVENKTYWAYEKLYSIIDTRYRSKKPLIITTNLIIEDLRKNLSIVDMKSGTYDTSNRIYNRIVEMCAQIDVEGESWRIQMGEENKDALFSELGLTTG